MSNGNFLCLTDWKQERLIASTPSRKPARKAQKHKPKGKRRPSRIQHANSMLLNGLTPRCCHPSSFKASPVATRWFGGQRRPGIGGNGRQLKPARLVAHPQQVKGEGQVLKHRCPSRINLPAARLGRHSLEGIQQGLCAAIACSLTPPCPHPGHGKTGHPEPEPGTAPWHALPPSSFSSGPQTWFPGRRPHAGAAACSTDDAPRCAECERASSCGPCRRGAAQPSRITSAMALKGASGPRANLRAAQRPQRGWRTCGRRRLVLLETAQLPHIAAFGLLDKDLGPDAKKQTQADPVF